MSNQHQPGTPRGEQPARESGSGGWQADVLAGLQAGGAPQATSHARDAQPAEDADRTILRPAPTAPVLPSRRRSAPQSHETPARVDQSRSGTVLRAPSTALRGSEPAPRVIAAVPGPGEVTPPAATQLRAPAPLVAGPGPELRDDLARLGRVRGDRPWTRAWRAASRVFTRDAMPGAFEAAASRLQAPVTTGRRVAVVAADGGVGQSTLAAACALVYASLRRDVTALVSLTTSPSPLGLRLGAETVVGTWQLGQTCLADEASDPVQVLLRFTRIAPSLVCSGATTTDQPVGPDQQSALSRMLSAGAAVSLFDCPSGIDARATRQAIAECHAVLLVGTASAVGVDHLRQVLDQVAGSRPVVVALVDVDRAGVHPAESAARRLERSGVRVHHVSWDRHLAAGGHLHLDHLAEKTRLELAELAADLLDQARKAG